MFAHFLFVLEMIICDKQFWKENSTWDMNVFVISPFLFNACKIETEADIFKMLIDFILRILEQYGDTNQFVRNSQKPISISIWSLWKLHEEILFFLCPELSLSLCLVIRST